MIIMLMAALTALSAGPLPSTMSPSTMSPELTRGLRLELSTAPGPLSEEALLLYEKACVGGDPGGCYHFERATRTRKLDDAAFEVTAKPLRAACDKDEARACFRLGMLLDDDGGLPRDGKAAFETFKKACGLGYGPACARVAVFYEVSVPSHEPDAPQQAVRHYRRACDAGYAAPCGRLARLVERRPELAKHGETHDTLLERACRRGDESACRDWAYAVLPQDLFSCAECAAAPHDHRCVECNHYRCCKEQCCPTCPGRTTHGCCSDPCPEKPPYPLERPKIAKQALDAAQRRLRPALDVLGRSCDRRDAGACADLAYIHSVEVFPTYDPAKERAFMTLACELGAPNGCRAAAKLLRTDKGGPADEAAAARAEARARELYKVACERGVSRACWAR